MKIILHSDDFGLHKEINRAILEAASQGVLTSTSLLVNGLAVEEAIEQVKSYPRLGVGIHLNIVRGRPLTDPMEIPSLVNRNGLFLNSAGTLLMKSFLGLLSSDEIYREYRRQILHMIDRGLRPTHFDGEKHTHLLLPEAVQALKRLMDEYDIRKVRTINESPINRVLFSSGIGLDGDIRQRLKLLFLESRTKKACKLWSNFKSPDFSFGVLMSGHIRYPDSVKMTVKILETPLEGTVEWMLHLGYPTQLNSRENRKIFGKFFLTHSRTEELKLVLSKEFTESIYKNQDNLISYREL
ncbi:MAG: ChbG/HpnK family deacetylase [Deltaproteobacteria bacterium]|nr:ChbG/HpnK family deacetylase [Deltaproteobacteria bacterium]